MLDNVRAIIRSQLVSYLASLERQMNRDCEDGLRFRLHFEHTLKEWSWFDVYEHALELIPVGPEQVHVLISDVVMGGMMSGIDAAIEICKVLPNCKVLLISGKIETSDMLMATHHLGHDFDILAKPFHPSVIIERLNAMSVVN